MQGQGIDFGEGPAEPRAGEAVGRHNRDDGHLRQRDAARQGDADAEAHGIAGRQHADRAPAAALHLVHEIIQRPRPHHSLAAVVRHHGEMARAADQGLGAVEERARRAAQAGHSILADADDGEPLRHQVSSARASALTAAAASALPPRRPRSVR